MSLIPARMDSDGSLSPDMRNNRTMRVVLKTEPVLRVIPTLGTINPRINAIKIPIMNQFFLKNAPIQ